MRDVSWVRNELYSRIEKTSDGCWEWTRSRIPKGYGQFRVLGEKYAHRVSFLLHHGPIFNGACVMHRCDNPPCVNPDHLVMGTLTANNRDMAEKKRSKIGKQYKTHCPQGHEYTEENTLWRKGRNARTCLICKREQDRVNQRRYRGQ